MKVPNLFIVGVAKAGTTSLHHHLNTHPEIRMSQIKEPHYFLPEDKFDHLFISDRPRGIADYEGLFTTTKAIKYAGESSPSYFWSEEACRDIHRFNPSSKIIILLRDPISRAYSHYNMEVHAEREKGLNFNLAVKRDLLNDDLRWGKKHFYIDLGLYYQGIKRYFSTFGRENVLILFYEEFFKDPNYNLEEVWNFLSIEKPNSIPPEDQIYNQNRYAGTLLKLLKKLPGRSLIPARYKSGLGKLLSSDGQLSKQVIKQFYPYFEKDLKDLDQELGITYYTEWYLSNYDIQILK